MAAAANAVELSELTKYYGRQLGVADLSFDVSAGEVFGFLGPNGAGKTTALRMLVGLLRITHGSAMVLGQDVTTAGPELRRRIGYLPGTLELYRNLTGAEYLRFVARMRGLDLQQEITGLAERLNLDLTRHIHDLSKGNQQKIGVVQAFMHSPDVLVLDEPTSGLDPIVQREFELIVDEATSRGAAVLLSSHILSEVEHLCDRVAIVNEGHLLVVERIDSLKQRAVRSVDLGFGKPMDAAPFAALPGVSEAVSHGGTVACTIVGVETELLRLAVEFGVETVRTHEPSLDEIFLSLVSGGDPLAAAAHDEDVA